MRWPLSIRAFHWALAGTVIFNFFWSDAERRTHEMIGYLAAGLVIWRIFWGFMKRRKLGYNIIARNIMFLLLLLVLALGVSGWMMDLDQFWGEEWLEDLHEQMSFALIAIVIVHVTGILWESFKTKRNLIFSMFTGKAHRFK